MRSILCFFALLEIIASASYGSSKLKCDNGFTRLLSKLRVGNPPEDHTDDLQLIFDNYELESQANSGIMDLIFKDYYSSDDYGGEGGHGCTMLTVAKVKGADSQLRPSEEEYLVVVGDGHNDCDGGNYYGLVLDWTKLQRWPQGPSTPMEDLIVGGIGDSEFYCN